MNKIISLALALAVTGLVANPSVASAKRYPKHMRNSATGANANGTAGGHSTNSGTGTSTQGGQQAH